MAMKRVHGDVEGERAGAQQRVFNLVRRIPRGRVMSYGQISELMAGRLSPRAVGWMLHRSPEDIPWQRVVNASGGCSTDRLPDFPKGLQRSKRERPGCRAVAGPAAFAAGGGGCEVSVERDPRFGGVSLVARRRIA